MLPDAALSGRTPRRGVPDRGSTLRCDLPFALVWRGASSSFENRDLGGRLFGMGSAGWAKPKQFRLGFKLNARQRSARWCRRVFIWLDLMVMVLKSWTLIYGIDA